MNSRENSPTNLESYVKIVITVEVPDGAAVSVGNETAAAAEHPSKGKKAAAPPESAPAAAPQAAPAASAPAAAAPATDAAPTYPAIGKVNDAISKLAGKDRDAAIAILTKYKAAKTPQLRPENYQAVIDEAEEAVARLDAASVQNPPSLV